MNNNKKIKVLFANVPADGHFNPLTGLAVHLKNIGCDVRWYSSTAYESKIKALDIPFYPFKKAMELTLENLDHHFPERKEIKNTIRKLNFDMVNFFILRSTEYYADIKEIHESFAFDVLIADVTFTGIPFVKDIMKIPVLTVGVLPIVETSKDLAPSGLGLTPATSFFGRRKQDLLRFLADKILFGKTNKLMRSILAAHGIHTTRNVFDLISEKSTLLLQSGSPGFEYKRSDLSKNIRFIGALLPHGKKRQQIPWYDKRVAQYRKIVLVTQGTAEKDISKLLMPTLDAFKNTDVLVIATTGGAGTAELRTKFPQHNFIIEDFIPFNEVMPYCHAYVTNGGYGGVMLGINNNLPMVVAGVHEGKNEINARIGYFELGVNLRTEFPKPAQVRSGVEAVIANKSFRKNVAMLKDELISYNPQLLCEQYVYEVTGKKPVVKNTVAEAVS
jgi:UDP:flavonoid glycosyltransferase YjiC (YdhE family)